MASAKALLGAVAGRFLFRHGQVTAVSRLSERFVRVDVAGPELAGATWVPGDKVQLFFPGVGMRTYTPVTWDAAGRTWFLGFLHGEGPGARWLREVKSGDPVALFGPRRSIDVEPHSGPLVVVGDETSLAVTVALTRARMNQHVTAVLEAGAPEELREVARGLELTHLVVTARGQLEDAVRAQLALGAVPVFTGNAATIQALKRNLKASGKTKAYWAAGKPGLD